MKINTINQTSFGTTLFTNKTFTSPPFTPEDFRAIRGMDGDFPPGRMDEFCKVASKFNDKIEADGHDRLCMEILSILDSESRLRITSGFLHHTGNYFVPVQESLIKLL
jgi:hypothetical protein